MMNNFKGKLFFILLLLFVFNLAFSYDLHVHYIDITQLPDIHLKVSIHDNQGYINFLIRDDFSFKMNNKPLDIKSFVKTKEAEDRFHLLLIFDESQSMRGGSIAISRKIARDIISYLSMGDIIAYIGINRGGTRIVDFTNNHNTINNALNSINTSRSHESHIDEEILSRINIFNRNIIQKGLKGAVFIFSNTANFSYDLSYDLSRKYPFVYIFNFGHMDTHISQLTSSNFFLNPNIDLDIRNPVNNLLNHRSCYYNITIKSNTGFDNDIHRLSINLDILPYDTFNYSFHAVSRIDSITVSNISELFYMNRFLMYLTLLTGLHIFLFFLLRLIKDYDTSYKLRHYYIRFIIGLIIIISLSFIMSIIY